MMISLTEDQARIMLLHSKSMIKMIDDLSGQTAEKCMPETSKRIKAFENLMHDIQRQLLEAGIQDAYT